MYGPRIGYFRFRNTGRRSNQSEDQTWIWDISGACTGIRVCCAAGRGPWKCVLHGKAM